MAHHGIEFRIVTRITSEGFKLWGFRVDALNRGQHPCWDTKREAVASATWHIDLWLRQRPRT